MTFTKLRKNQNQEVTMSVILRIADVSAYNVGEYDVFHQR